MPTEIVGLQNKSGLPKHQINFQYLQILLDLNRLKFEILEELLQKQPKEQPSVVDTAYQALATLGLNSGIPEVIKVAKFIYENGSHSISILPNSFLRPTIAAILVVPISTPTTSSEAKLGLPLFVVFSIIFIF